MNFRNWIARQVVSLARKAYTLDDLFLTGKEMPYSAIGPRQGNVSRAYTNSQAAYACIRRIASDISSTPLRFYSAPEEGRELRHHVLIDLFNKPAPGYTIEQTMNLFVIYLLLRGESTLVTDNVRPSFATGLYSHFDPMHWKPLTRSEPEGETLVAWKYRHQTEEIVRAPDDMVHCRLPGLRRWRGQSPLEACANQVLITELGPGLNARKLEQGGEGGRVYKTPHELQDTQYDQLKARIAAQRGGPGKPAGDIILEGGLDIVDPRFSKTDLDILGMLPMSKEDICQAFGMSPTIIGQANEANYSTFRGYMKIYWEQTVLPLMRNIQQSMDTWTSKWDCYVRFDISQVDALKDYLAEKAKTGKMLYAMHVPPREINRRLNMQLDEAALVAADEVMTNMSMVPLSQAATGRGYDRPQAGANSALSRAESHPPTKSVAPAALSFDAAMAAAQRPTLAVPHQRRLATHATKAKPGIRQALSAMDRSGLRAAIAAEARYAFGQGAALAVQAIDPDVSHQDAEMATRDMGFILLTGADLYANDCYETLLAPLTGEPGRAAIQKQVNLVNPLVSEMSQKAALAGFTARLQAMSVAELEEI